MDIKNENKDNLVISEEVIAKIATTTALEVQGVAGVVNKPVDIKKILSKSSGTKSVYVQANDAQTEIDIYLSLKSGAKVKTVAEQVQQDVKEAVQNMTSKVVGKVNVHICEIELEKEEKAEP